MKRLLFVLLAFVALCTPARAQQPIQAFVVANCGTLPTGLTYVAGNYGIVTMDTTGKLCSSASGGGTSSNFNTTFPTAGTAAGMSQGGNMVAFTGNANNLNVNEAQIGGTNVIADPCQSVAKSTLPISQTSSTAIVPGTAGKKTYVCSILSNGADAEALSVVEGTTTTTPCDTGAVAKLGSTTPANGMNFQAGAGLGMGNGSATVIALNAANGDNVCLFQSGTGRVAGYVTYVQQ